MWVGRVRKKHIFFNPNIKRVKSGEKYKKAINQYIRLLQREEKEGTTKRIVNARAVCVAKIKKYGISVAQMNDVLQNKGLKYTVTSFDAVQEGKKVAPKKTAPKATAPAKETKAKVETKTTAKAPAKKAAPKKTTPAKKETTKKTESK